MKNLASPASGQYVLLALVALVVMACDQKPMVSEGVSRAAAAAEASGQSRVHQLSVMPSPEASMAVTQDTVGNLRDVAVATAIHAALLEDPKLSALPIGFDPRAGLILGAATASGPGSRAHAHTLAKQVEGVAVVNKRVALADALMP